ncbi:hypothetical protein D3OALGA1CA_2655 [Olavius algarvensis associated proteobacterium Delta 3]|nr:hypothetical protein D3OALGA1CA_2655 [Olavius algarvensis associated proteobacterium Delta 3]CAB5132142.1 hypothetical protein D3OALGB2SA_3706 [Olavius algarvensis associated proteobacterium Delta 3]
MSMTFFSLALFFGLVVLLAFLRIKTAGRFTIETREIVAAIVVVGLVLFVSGEIKEIAFGDVRLIREIKKAAKAPVKENVATRQVDTISSNTLRFEESRTGTKGSVERIPMLIETKADALSFQLGSDYYVASAIAMYLEELTKAPFLQYLVFTNPKGEFVGVADARAIAEQFAPGDSSLTPRQLTRAIQNANIAWLRQLPGYIGANDALSAGLSTREALSQMLERNVDKLPVIDGAKQFIGVAYQSQLMGNILMAITPEGKQ